MLKTLCGSIALLALFAGVTHAAEQLPTTARKIVLEKAETGYRWKLVEAPVPQPGDRQVLVRVRAVGLNRGDWEVLGANNSKGTLVGRIPGSDAAGDIVVVGKNVKEFRPGMPPSVAFAPGSTGKNKPVSRRYEFSCSRVTPGWMTQSASA